MIIESVSENEIKTVKYRNNQIYTNNDLPMPSYQRYTERNKQRTELEVQLDCQRLHPDGLKNCSKCSKKIPATVECFSPSISSRDGLAYWCRKCSVEHSNNKHLQEITIPYIIEHFGSLEIYNQNITEGKKPCLNCNEWFVPWRTTFQSHCKPCEKKKQKIRDRKRQLSKYGLTEEIYQEMIFQQNNKCACCGIEFGEYLSSSAPMIDHCHKTNKVRDIICQLCNMTEGQIQAIAEAAGVTSDIVISKIIAYMNKHS